MPVVTIEKDEKSKDYKLPLHKKVLEEMGWQEGDTLAVTKMNKTIHLTKIIENLKR